MFLEQYKITISHQVIDTENLDMESTIIQELAVPLMDQEVVYKLLRMLEEYMQEKEEEYEICNKKST